MLRKEIFRKNTTGNNLRRKISTFRTLYQVENGNSFVQNKKQGESKMFTTIVVTSPWWGSVTVAALEAAVSAIIVYDFVSILTN
jgi:hypothetical protein